MPITRARTFHAQSGFTLVVIAALFIAFAVIAAVAIERNTTVQQITRRDDTRAQLQRLSNAIIEYSVFNATTINLYPCPASLNVASTLGTFGQSVNDGVGPAFLQNCSTTGTDVAGTPNTTATGIPIMGATGTAVLRGMVPVQNLAPYGIGINDAFDPWNNRIMYVVNRQLTTGGSLNQGLNPTLTFPMTGATTPAIPAPDFILISYGKDGVGGIKRSTTGTPQIACGSSATSTIFRLENCDVDTAFISMPTYTMGDADGTATGIATNVYFDDILTWYRQ
jgi:hypothetical protein